MQTWKIYCDRCGKEAAQIGSELNIVPIGSPIKESYDLCTECTNKLREELFATRSKVMADTKKDNKD